MSIGKSILSIVIVLVTAAILALGYTSKVMVAQVLKQNVISRLQYAARSKAETLKVAVQETEEDMVILASHKAIENYFTSVVFEDTEEMTNSLFSLEAFFSHIFHAKPQYEKLQLTDIAGKPILQMNSGVRTEKFDVLATADFLAQLQKNPSGQDDRDLTPKVSHRIVYDNNQEPVLLSALGLVIDERLEGILWCYQPMATQLMDIVNDDSEEGMISVIADAADRIVVATGGADQQTTAGLVRGVLGGWLVFSEDIVVLDWRLSLGMTEGAAFAVLTKLVYTGLMVLLVTLVLLSIILTWAIGRIVKPVRILSDVVSRVAAGDLDQEVQVDTRNEIGRLADNFGVMLSSLRRETENNARQQWLDTGQADLDSQMRGEYSVTELAERIISYLCMYCGAAIGALFVDVGNHTFELAGGFSCNITGDRKPSFKVGEGLVGQAVLDRVARTVSDAPDGYFTVCTSLVQGSPGYIRALPCINGQEVVAALEIGFFAPLSDLQTAFLEKAAGSIAISMSMALSRRQLDNALQKSQQMAEELQSQQEELRVSNEELEEQAKRLQASEEELKAQQEELQAANEELLEKARMLQEVS